MLDAQLGQAFCRFGDEGSPVEVSGRVKARAGESNEQMLMHQRAAELIKSDRTRNGLNLHASNLLTLFR